ncbi:MAG: hypothetical protein Q9186_000340 [Xanthomendoza sp. 1 TL-2023]
MIVLPAPTISNVHLRLYSIRYDPDVEPFVYAENLSLNGVDWAHWCGTSLVSFPVPRGQAILLSSGDKLCLCDQTRELERNAQITFTFQTRLPASELLTSTQMDEQRDPDCRQVLEKAAFDNMFTMTDPSEVSLQLCYIIEELVTGGDLMSLIERSDWRVEPEECCLIVYQVLKAVAYLHQRGITHRDLKPENILMSSTLPGARVILTDFGGAIKISTNQIHGANGLVKESGYTKAVDMWSVGCVTAALLNGRPAFATSQVSGGEEESAAAVIAAAGKCNLGGLDDAKVWGDIDPQGKEFIRRVLVRDEKARLTANQGLMHEWFTQQSDGQLMVTRYERAIADWKATYPGWDFKEDLDRCIKFRTPESDVGLIAPATEAVTDTTL